LFNAGIPADQIEKREDKIRKEEKRETECHRKWDEENNSRIVSYRIAVVADVTTEGRKVDPQSKGERDGERRDETKGL
jgi:hypothetical protein